jgi:uncharacterized protein (TIGR02246 family)
MNSECRRRTAGGVCQDGAVRSAARPVWFGVLALAAWAPTGGAQQSAGDVVAQIRALELTQNAAIAHGDAAAMAKVTSADFTFITPRGFLLSRAQMLQGLSDGQFQYEYREITDLDVRVYGDAAVVTGRSLYSAQKGGKEMSDNYRYTRTYVRQQGVWLAVAWQITRID